MPGTSADGLAVETRGLTKRFGPRVVVDRLDLAIPRGAVSGFVGPNGAGKTTTIRMLLGLIRPNEGSGQVLGQELTRPERYLDQVGALIEAPAFYPQLTGRANLSALARLGWVDRSIIDEVLERVGLRDRGDDRFRDYSLGMKQRLGIAAALLVRPSLLVLDEPANGLDPAGIVEIRRLVRSLTDQGMTIFVSSHLLAEIEQVCDHLVMIRDGQLLFQGRIAELHGRQQAELVVRPEFPEQMAALRSLLENAGRTCRDRDGDLIVAANADWAPNLNRLAMEAGITLAHLSESARSLEAAFFELTGTETGDLGETTAGGSR